MYDVCFGRKVSCVMVVKKFIMVKLQFMVYVDIGYYGYLLLIVEVQCFVGIIVGVVKVEQEYMGSGGYIYKVW